MQIKGREVYKFAVQRFEELIEDAMRKCELTADEVKLIIPHQVNQRIIDSAMEKLGFPAEKAFVNIDKYGNTSAASIPIALDEAMRARARSSSGDVIDLRRVRRGADLGQRGGANVSQSGIGPGSMSMRPAMANNCILCPGQGAQAVGMGKDFFEASPAAQEVFEAANRVLGFDLAALCFGGPEERLNQTDISQPAIYTTSVACFRAAARRGMIDPARGHGVRGTEPRRIHGAAPGGRVQLRGWAETGRRARPVHAGCGRRDAQRHGRDHGRG